MFITLTYRAREGITPEHAAKDLATAWRNAVKRLERAWKRPHIEYFAVFERTAKGWPHLHILARAKYIPQKWLSRTMDELCGSPVVDIRRIANIRQATWYVTKYVGKGPAKIGTCKRYWRTGKYFEKQTKNDAYDGGRWYELHVCKTNVRQYIAEHFAMGWRLQDEAETWHILELPDRWYDGPFGPEVF